MNEKEKMISAKPYLSADEQLVNERQHAKEVLYEYNNLAPRQKEKRDKIIEGLLGKIEDNFWIESPFRCDYGYNVFIGKNFYSNYNGIILDCAKVAIGDNVMLGPNVSILTAGHPLHFELRNTGIEYAFPITIGNNVWIGAGAILNPGVNVGDNTVIGSGSIVTKDIPSNSVAVGNPCKVIRNITEEDKKYYFKNLKVE